MKKRNLILKTYICYFDNGFELTFKAISIEDLLLKTNKIETNHLTTLYKYYEKC
jgi:hypothetical protein